MRRLVLALVLLFVPACTTPVSSGLDPDRLLNMAGEEAGAITAPKERFTRQLNIADRQIDNHRGHEARDTLRAARATLERADQAALTEHERLAGWVSLSELGRRADDLPFAGAALDQAQAALDALNPHQDRCQYVLGVERELRALRGDAAAAALLVTAADWAAELPDQPRRRSAYYAFAEELFRCNDYGAARTLLRRDTDAAWRSDALRLMSDRARSELAMRYGSSFGSSSASGSAPSATPAEVSAELQIRSFSKPLDFQSNFYRGK